MAIHVHLQKAGTAPEREAVRVADRVMRAPVEAPRGRLPAPDRGDRGRPAPTSVSRVLAQPGLPLEPSLRHDMETRLGHDFSRVRIHDDPVAAESARDVNANAYTVGDHVAFDRGRFAPATLDGRRLLAHELTHVVQQAGGVSLQRDDKQSHTDFILSDKEMEHLESLLLKLYEKLPREERIDLKANGTVAVGLVTKRNLNEPRYVYTTASNVASKAFREAAESVGLEPWVGDAGVAEERQGPSRNYPATGPAPPGTGGIEHAEQLMIGHAEDNGYVVHGMAVSRRLCHDCPLVVSEHKGGRIKVSVIQDPDKTLPNPRREPRPPKKPEEDKPPEPGAVKKPPPAPTKAKKPDTDPPAAEKPTETPASKTTPAPPAPKEVPKPPPAKRIPEPPATKKPPKPPTTTKAPDPPAAKKPVKAAATTTTPPAEPARGGGSSKLVGTTGRSAAHVFSTTLGQVNSKLTQIALKDPETAAAIADINKLLDAEAFMKDPKRFTSQFLSGYLIDSAFGALSRQLAAAEAQFFSTYPDVESFRQRPVIDGRSLDELHQAYDLAVRGLRTPNARKTIVSAFVMLSINDQTPQAEIDRRKQLLDEYLARQPDFGQYITQYDDARRNYVHALGAVELMLSYRSSQLGQLPADFGDDLRRRGDALSEAAGTLEKFGRDVELIPLPGAAEAGWMLLKLAEGFSGLGEGLHGFASRAGARKGEYDRELERLEAVSDRLSRVRSAFEVMYPPPSP